MDYKDISYDNIQNLPSKEYIIENGRNGADKYWDVPGGLFWGGLGDDQVFINYPEDNGGEPYSGIIYECYPDGTISNYETYKDSYWTGDVGSFYENGVAKGFKLLDGDSIILYSFYPNKKLKGIRTYPSNSNQELMIWSEDGVLIEHTYFTNKGQLIESQKWDKYGILIEYIINGISQL